MPMLIGTHPLDRGLLGLHLAAGQRWLKTQHMPFGQRWIPSTHAPQGQRRTISSTHAPEGQRWINHLHVPRRVRGGPFPSTRGRFGQRWNDTHLSLAILCQRLITSAGHITVCDRQFAINHRAA